MLRRDLLKLAAGAAIPENKTTKVLYFTRSAGFEHSVVRRQGSAPSYSEKVLAELGRRAGFEFECTKDGRVFDGDLGRFDAIAFYTSGDLTAPAKDGSSPMSPAGKRKLLDAIAAGKGFVGIHSATDTFHSKGADPDPYIAMLGGEFAGHGEQQEASLILSSRFPAAGTMAMGEGLAFTEEWYASRNFAADLHVILVQETKLMRGAAYQRPNYPCTWARMHGKGRVFYTSLGHREDVWINPFFHAIVLGGFRWTTGKVDFDVKPNLELAAPEANRLKS